MNISNQRITSVLPQTLMNEHNCTSFEFFVMWYCIFIFHRRNCLVFLSMWFFWIWLKIPFIISADLAVSIVHWGLIYDSWCSAWCKNRLIFICFHNIELTVVERCFCFSVFDSAAFPDVIVNLVMGINYSTMRSEEIQTVGAQRKSKLLKQASSY